jgi:hypothetical protein
LISHSFKPHGSRRFKKPDPFTDLLATSTQIQAAEKSIGHPYELKPTSFHSFERDFKPDLKPKSLSSTNCLHSLWAKKT